MKNSRDTIISFIERLYSDNNNLMIRYEYNEIKGKHIVEILSKTGVLCEEFIWESKYDLSRMIKKEFGEKAEPLYPRIVKYFQIMESYHFVNFINKPEK